MSLVAIAASVALQSSVQFHVAGVTRDEFDEVIFHWACLGTWEKYFFFQHQTSRVSRNWTEERKQRHLRTELETAWGGHLWVATVLRFGFYSLLEMLLMLAGWQPDEEAGAQSTPCKYATTGKGALFRAGVSRTPAWNILSLIVAAFCRQTHTVAVHFACLRRSMYVLFWISSSFIVVIWYIVLLWYESMDHSDLISVSGADTDVTDLSDIRMMSLIHSLIDF